MQLFRCPFCGERDETEFHYTGEAGVARPEGDDVSRESWVDYLYMRGNRKGVTDEIWLHMPCGGFFVMRRDSVSHEVHSSLVLEAAETSS